MAEMKKRPVSLTITAIVLTWLALAGFANAAAGMMGNPIVPAAYGVTALLAAIGIWKARRWGFVAYVVWGVVVIIMGLVIQNGQLGIPTAQFAGFLAMVILVIAGWGIIVWRGLNKKVLQSD